MKHPPSATVGRKYWLAKVWTTPEAHIEKSEYCFSLADFDPTNLSIESARKAGRAKTLFPPYGPLFGAQIWRMAHEANIGDVVFLESANRHLHAWGTIISTFKQRSVNKPTNDNLIRAGIHQIGVEWYPTKNGKDAFRIGKGDNLLFREVTERETLMPILLKFIDGPLPTVSRQDGDEAPQDLEYTEGGKVLRTHLRTERDGKAAQQAKALARRRAKNGKLTCESCAYIPEDDYHGFDLIEAHHRVPLSLGVRETKPTDFAMLCPNCHRAVHRLINDGLGPELALIKVKRP